ncbi:MAG: hypothetical protein M3Q22_03555 [Actinomycetota bacterium]|nr:hypothetical protein [Actinomycetota bacterium]
MRTLLGHRLAPVTSQIGFLRLPLEDAGRALAQWRRGLYGDVDARPVAGPLPGLVRRLEPLTGGSRARELLLRTAAPDWTAYLDCSLTGTDADSVVGHLSRTLLCQGLVATAVPHTLDRAGRGRYGAVQFTLLGPLQTGFLNIVRSVSVAHDGSRWRFDADGTEQDFETPDRYTARRVRERFTSDMLAGYCAALGVRPFDEDFYGPDALLFTSPVPTAPDGKIMTIEQAQAFHGIDPDRDAQTPG